MDKAAQRQAVEARRRGLSPEAVVRWGGEVQRHLAALPFLTSANTVAAYAAQPFEVPLFAVCSQLKRVVFPRIRKPSRVLEFCDPRPGPLPQPGIALWSPPESALAVPLEEIDVWLVPGVAFSRDGKRLGRGKAYYDSTLAQRRADAITIGITFELQVLDDVATEPHDVTMDYLATERGVFTTRRSA